MDAPVHACRIATSKEAAKNMRLLELDVPRDLQSRATVPGQWVEAGPPGGPHARFVLCSPAGAEAPWELLLRAGGRAADALAALPPGSSVEVSAPRGAGFAMDRVLEGERDVVLVCAGSAIAALRPVLHAIRGRHEKLERVRLYYGVETRAHAAFCTEIESWRKEGLAARLCLSREAPGPDGAKGHVQDVLVAERTSLAQAVVLCAGPAALVRTLRQGLPAVGLAAGSVRTNE